MHIIVCLDNHNGMAFNHRRQSKDREVTADITKMTKDHTLWMTDYSKSLFDEISNIKTDENPVVKAQEDDFVLLEQKNLQLENENIQTLTVYRWNRVYPADTCLVIPENWKLLSTSQFPGYSHEIITKESYHRMSENIIEITDLTLPELLVYSSLNEAQLLHYFEPAPGIFIAESPKVIERALDFGCEPMSFLMEKKHIETQGKSIIDRCKGVPVYTAPPEVLEKITGYKLARGMLCAMHRPKLPLPEELCKNSRRIAVLENVVNPTNVGAIFRSAAALGMDAVLLTSACSDPLYRRAIRVSMGTVFQIPWVYIETKSRKWPADGMDFLHEYGFKTVAMALRNDSVRIDDKKLHEEEKLAIILGTEGDGLLADTMADCDYTVKIPMSHGVDSLNVAAASAVAFYELGR